MSGNFKLKPLVFMILIFLQGNTFAAAAPHRLADLNLSLSSDVQSVVKVLDQKLEEYPYTDPSYEEINRKIFTLRTMLVLLKDESLIDIKALHEAVENSSDYVFEGTLFGKDSFADVLNLFRVKWKRIADFPAVQKTIDSPAVFQSRISDHLVELGRMNDEEIGHLALYRVMEMTNGCTQMAFRFDLENSLGEEVSRTCMRLSMGSIKSKTLSLEEDEMQIVLSERAGKYLERGRQAYLDFKAGHRKLDKNEDDETGKFQIAEFYRISTAQIVAMGNERLHLAREIFARNFVSLFTRRFIAIGRKYLNQYQVLVSDDSEDHRLHPEHGLGPDSSWGS